MFAGVTAEALHDASAGANEEEMTDGDSASIEDGENEDGNADCCDSPCEVVRGQDRPQLGEPWGRSLVAENVINEPFDRPWLEQIDECGKNQDCAAGY